jgi:hypothetical protein
LRSPERARDADFYYLSRAALLGGPAIPEDVTSYMLTGEDFRRRNRIGMTLYYRELAIGRLEAVKCGGKTMHTPAQESAWRASLPKYQPRRMSLANEQQEQRTA